MKNVKERMDISFDHRAPSIVTELEAYRDGYLGILSRGGKIRCLTDITQENLPFSKKLVHLVSELRHFSGLKGGIAVNGTEYMATSVLREAKPLTMVIYSNVIELVEQGQSIFDAFWNNAIPAEQRIRELQDGVEAEYIEVIREPAKASQLVIDYVNSIQYEAELILPVSETSVRLHKLGVWDCLIKASNQGARIRVISPLSEINSDLITEISRKSNIKILSGEPASSGLFIADDSKFLRADMRNQNASDTEGAIGTLLHSNSKSTVEQFKTFFELLWKQAEHYENLLNYNSMQKEFITVAAHELRTPVQPILGLAEVLRGKATDDDTRLMLDIIIKNANRLIRLEENILDITKLESSTLTLRREDIDLKQVIRESLEYYKPQIAGRKVTLISSFPDYETFVAADRDRIGQVIANLLSNALKFTKAGKISITEELDANGQSVTVKIKDTGKGIDPAIMPRLFTKFATKSEDGTGLGLFICKSIVEAHGGKIWAENNSTGKGATFSFTIPVSDPDRSQK